MMGPDDTYTRLSHAFNTEAFYTNYRNTFTVLKADTPELLEACFRLRYLVYGAENGFQRFDHKERLEYDEHDRRAVHFLLQHNESGKHAGTARIILPNDAQPLKSFPLQTICDHPLLHGYNRPETFCQISRLCMHPDFRRREHDGKILPAYHPQEDIKTTEDGKITFIRRRIPYAPLGLFMAAFETALEHRIADCLMLVEADQLPHFKRMGMAYSTLGPKLRHNGLQQPVVFNIKQVLDTMVLENPGCWDVISDMGRVHKMANALYNNDWRDHLMDDLDWEHIWEKLS